MRRFLFQFSIFTIPIIIYSILAIFIIPSLLTIQNGPSTKQQIDLSFENAIKLEYDVLILGNSRTYRGLNPDIFSMNTFNFSHDNDSYNQLFYKLRFLLENKKDFKYLILGVDYFQFSFLSNSRNYVYADYLGVDYLNDYSDNVFLLKLKYHFSNIDPQKLLLLKPNKNIPVFRENGQFIVSGIADENDAIQRDIKRLKIQEEYFKRIIDLCDANNIKVFLIMLPIRQNELNSYSAKEIINFNKYINTFVNDVNIYYLDYSLNNDFETKDYTDITHFNEAAADRFSKMVNDSLVSIIKHNQ